ncbi:hypothetical protein PVAP13_5NG332762 [Panicum virgatum]|uniref:Uncharacterized protein n=1 Tax=Panicum virgatum TaxID=38727 RepID=A0A8T0RVJ7_PANVG|nr:hypothetical protein PVAP13_5NG332762 [Panicum virgatum]
MWPKATHGFFMHPPLLKSTAGRRKNWIKSALEGGSSRKKPTEGGTGRKQHECPICHELGHHWYTCKNGNPGDIATMEAERGPPKKKLKKSSRSNTQTSIVVPTSSASGMVFPHNEAVANATHKKGKRKSSTKLGVSKRKGSTTTTSTSMSSRKKQATMKKKKKLTPKRAPVEIVSPESPASNTRSKKKLQME